MPNIVGYISATLAGSSSGIGESGALYRGGSYGAGQGITLHLEYGTNIDASRSSGAYGAGGAQRVRPRAFAALACVYLGA